MSTNTPDLNDRMRAGTLPSDPFAGEKVSEDFPRISTVRDLLADSMRHCFDQSPRSYSTFAHPAIDEATGGAVPGEVTFLGADSSWGKSSYALMVADENAKLGRRVLVVSAEDSRLTFGNRLMRRRAKVSASNMRHRRLTKEELERVADVAAKAEAVPAFIDARSHTIEWLVPRLKAAIAEHEIDLLVCDYVGAFNKSKTLNDQGQRGTTQYIARTLVDSIKTCTPEGIAGLILTQITQDEKQPIPGKYSLRDSKDQVHMAENVLIGFIAPREIRSSSGAIIAREGDRCLKVAKAKEGEAGQSVIVLPWDSHSACFGAVTDDPSHDVPAYARPRETSDDDWEDGTTIHDASAARNVTGRIGPDARPPGPVRAPASAREARQSQPVAGLRSTDTLWTAPRGTGLGHQRSMSAPWRDGPGHCIRLTPSWLAAPSQDRVVLEFG